MKLFEVQKEITIWEQKEENEQGENEDGYKNVSKRRSRKEQAKEEEN